METTVTCSALALGIGLVGLASWLEHRPRDLMRPRLVPTTPLMFLGALVAILAAVHLMTLFGVSRPGQ
ncbi:MAG: hypothetical protein AB7S41_12695 [Parvibaculaceae bacterium]|jgi:hypothetical protein